MVFLKGNFNKEDLLHARVAVDFIKLIKNSGCNVYFITEDKEINCKSMIGILKLNIKKGDTIHLKIEGENHLELFLQIEELLF
ncbi:MAG: HPr family phosphocarrier protein [Peptostreptococcaceae bacterium]